MNELLQILLQVLQDVEASFDELTDQEADAIAQVLNQATEFLVRSFEEQQPEQAPPPEAPVTGPIPFGADLLWILAGSDPNAFVNYLRTYPGEGFAEIAQDPNQLAALIGRFQQEMPQGEPQVDADGMEQTMYQSSNVSAMKYDPRNNKLWVKFHGNNGEPVYQYDGVPPQIFELIKHGNAVAQTTGQNRWGRWWRGKEPSIGRAVVDYLKRGGFNYSRIR